MKTKFAALTIFVSLVIASFAFADRGGWVSSGGELFRFGKNPWFLKNVTEVSYCVQVDTRSVSASPEVVADVIKEAIQYWKNEFGVTTGAPGVGFAAVGTQNFKEVSACDASVPLQFRIGYGALEKEEAEHLVVPEKFVGVSIRKEYDYELLSGKGIVFISSDLGPHSYSAAPNSGQLYPEAWKERRLLLYALIHELGHVFGIPHTGSGLMSEVFLEQLLHKRFYRFYIDNPVASFLRPPMVAETCSIFGSFNPTFFQIPTDTSCIRLEGNFARGSYEWAVSYRKTATSPLIKAGVVKANIISALAMAAKPAVVVQLPSEQKVFSLAERQMNTFMIGPLFTESTARGLFNTATSSRTYDLQIELRPEAIVMTGLVSGKMMPVFIYSPPSLLMQIFPVGP